VAVDSGLLWGGRLLRVVVREEGGRRVVVGARGGSSFVVQTGRGLAREEMADAAVGRGRANGGLTCVGSVEEGGVGGGHVCMVDAGEGGVVAGKRVTRGLRGDG
jgi:hypothetical protein